MALSIWSSAKIDGYYVRVVLSGLTVRAGLFVELVFSHSRPGSFLIDYCPVSWHGMTIFNEDAEEEEHRIIQRL